MLFIASIYLIFDAKSDQEKDSEIINIAGRQRMLSQRIAFFAERIVKGEQALVVDYMKLIQTCDHSLKILQIGGQSPISSSVTISGTPEDVMPVLEKAKALWLPYRRNARKVATDGDNNALRYIEDHAETMLSLFNELTKAYVLENLRKQKALDRFLLLLAVLNVIAFGLSLMYVKRKLVNPILNLGTSIRHLSKGKALENSPSETSERFKDEIAIARGHLRTLGDSLYKIALFAEKISRGDLEVDYIPLSDFDKTGKSLLQMRQRVGKIVAELEETIADFRKKGKVNTSLSLEKKEGAWKQVGLGINDLFATISEPIEEARVLLKAVAEGDLATKFEGEFAGDFKELLDSINTAIDNTSGLIIIIQEKSSIIEDKATDMLSSYEEITYNLKEIASAIGEISSGASNQLQEIGEVTQQILSIRRLSEIAKSHASKIASLSATSRSLSQSGEVAMNGIRSLHVDMQQSSQESVDYMTDLVNRSGEIEQIVSTIGRISAKTNLLAFNAAIQAAKAGENGYGFSVVAEEIRQLAEQAQASAGIIQQLVGEIQEGIEEASIRVQAVGNKIEQGAEQTNKANDAISRIALSINESHQYAEKIAASIIRQVGELNMIVSRSEAVVAVAEESSAGTSQVASSISELSSAMNSYHRQFTLLTEVSSDLKQQAEQFRVS